MRDRKLTSYDHAYLSLTIIHKTIVATDILTTVSSFILSAKNGNLFPTRTHRSFNSLGDESKLVLDRIIVFGNESKLVPRHDGEPVPATNRQATNSPVPLRPPCGLGTRQGEHVVLASYISFELCARWPFCFANRLCCTYLSDFLQQTCRWSVVGGGGEDTTLLFSSGEAPDVPGDEEMLFSDTGFW